MIWNFLAWSFVAIPLLIAAGIICAVTGLKRKHSTRTPFVAIAGMATALLFVLLSVQDIWGGNITSFQMNAWPAPFGITIVVDAFTILLSVMITGIGLAAAVFSYRYIKERRPEYYGLLCILMAGLLGIVHTGDMFNLFVFFEISNIASYALVGYYRKAKSAEAGIKYLIVGSVASSMILLGIALLYASVGTLNMAGLSVALAQSTSVIVPISLALLISGFAFKCGLVPFHFWMPDAYQGAPSPVAAVLAALSANAGIYSILRVGVSVFSSPQVLLTTLAVFGIASMVTGAVLAIMQSDLKRMLAYSGVSQIGYILMAVGLGTTLGMTGGVFHIINHTIIKSLLFLSAGVIIYHAGTSNMYEVGKKVRFSPAFTYIFLVGVLALAGIPFLNGFASKWIIYISTFEITPLLTVFTIIISVLTFAYGIKAFYLMFLSGSDSAARTKTPWSMMAPLVVLALLCIMIGIIPQIGTGVSEAISAGLDPVVYAEAVLG